MAKPASLTVFVNFAAVAVKAAGAYHYDLLSGSIQSAADNSAILTFEACVYMGDEVYNITYKGQLVQQ